MDQGKPKFGAVTPSSDKQLRLKRAEAAAFRGFMALAGRLGLSSKEASRVIKVDEVEFERLRKQVVPEGYFDAPLPEHVSGALHQMLSARRTLRSLFVLPQHADQWLRSQIGAEPFNGRSAVEYLREGGDAQAIVDYLERRLGDAGRD